LNGHTPRVIKTWHQHFRRFWPHRKVAEILLPHDNIQPYTSLNTKEAITKFGGTVLPHSPYSPDLASSDFPPL